MGDCQPDRTLKQGQGVIMELEHIHLRKRDKRTPFKQELYSRPGSCSDALINIQPWGWNEETPGRAVASLLFVFKLERLIRVGWRRLTLTTDVYSSTSLQLGFHRGAFGACLDCLIQSTHKSHGTNFVIYALQGRETGHTKVRGNLIKGSFFF